VGRHVSSFCLEKSGLQGKNPKAWLIFCGVLPDANPIPPYSDHQFPSEQKSLVKSTSLTWLSALAFLWPNTFNQGQFIGTDLLSDPLNGNGSERFNSQYWRANIDPSGRYVLSSPKTLESRLMAGDAGFDNLFLAGDWILNGLNFGCIKSCVMGGLEASRAICGYPKYIVGETD
jgi:hypothetical protein